jgi:hypothetical protein
MAVNGFDDFGGGFAFAGVREFGGVSGSLSWSWEAGVMLSTRCVYLGVSANIFLDISQLLGNRWNSLYPK